MIEFFNLMFIFEREREREREREKEHESGKGMEREGGRESEAGFVLPVQSLMWGSNP